MIKLSAPRLRLLFALGFSAALHAETTPANETNPLLHESPLSFHYPQFDLIKNEHFLPAF